MHGTAAIRRPLVSAIVNFFDEERFLREAVESILAQTYGHWELLLADDGSTDSSPEIARRYAESYPGKIRYLEHPDRQNRGASAARNLGIRYARGEYIALLDADDVWLPHKLERQVDIMESHPEAGMLCGATEWWLSWAEDAEEGSDYTVDVGVAGGSLWTPPALLTMFLDGKARVPCTSSILLRTEIANAIGGFEESFFRRIYEDQAFYAKVCLKTPVLVSSECWSKYRQHSRSSCSIAAQTGEHDAARLFYLDWLERYLWSNRIRDRGLWLALKRKQWRHRYPKLYGRFRKGHHWLAQFIPGR